MDTAIILKCYFSYCPHSSPCCPRLETLAGSGGFDYSSVGARDTNSLKILCYIPRSAIVKKIYLLREPGSVFPVSCLPPTEQEVN